MRYIYQSKLGKIKTNYFWKKNKFQKNEKTVLKNTTCVSD